MRSRCVPIFCALLQASASAQNPAAPSVSGLVAVESVKIQKDQVAYGFVPIEVTLRTVSHHDIYGIGIDLNLQFADGSARTRPFEMDLVGSYLPRSPHEVGPVSPELATFRSGETWHRKIDVPLGPGGTPVGAQSRVKMVAFEDGSAFGPREAIERLTQMRAVSLELHSSLLADFKAVATSSDPILGAEQRRKQYPTGSRSG